MFRFRHELSGSSLIIRLAVAQSPAAEPPPPPISSPYGLFSSVNPSLAIALLILIFVFFFFGFFSIYVRLREENDAVLERSCDGWRRCGLDPSAMDAFPAFPYSSPVKKIVKGGAVECSICLSDFEQGDKLRLLPRCGHVFHADCIDCWLVRHVTCPVCRAELEPGGLTAESRAGLSNHVVINVYR